MDALKIDKGNSCGLRLGERGPVNIVSALWPERTKATVSVSGYLIGSQEANKMPAAAESRVRLLVPVFILPQSAGGLAMRNTGASSPKLIWKTASPQWQFDDATFDRSAAAFDNPDHVAISIHNYRWRLGLAEGEAKFDALEKRLAEFPVITVPTITMEGDANGAPHPDPSAYAKKFSGKYEHRLIKGGVGHNLPQEAPRASQKLFVDLA